MQTNPSIEAVARLGTYLATFGAHKSAWYVLRGACTKATQGALSLSDLPDLPCLMNAGDEIASLFETEGASANSLRVARDIAGDAVAELLAEEGIEMEGAE